MSRAEISCSGAIIPGPGKAVRFSEPGSRNPVPGTRFTDPDKRKKPESGCSRACFCSWLPGPRMAGEVLRSYADSQRFANSGGADVFRLRALGTLNRVELDCLTLLQRTKTLHLNRAVVDKEVFAAVAGRDEPVALRVAEPLDCA
jgi:hypothetical protein